MNYYALVMKNFEYARALQVNAERYEQRGEQVLFFRDERIVHQVPTEYVAKIERFDTDLQATKYIRDIRERRHGSAALHVVEMGSTRRKKKNQSAEEKGGASFIETFTVSVEGRVMKPYRSKR